MEVSHIGSKNTLLQALKDLHQAGYITYQAPLHRFASGKVAMRPLDNKDQPTLFSAASALLPQLHTGTVPTSDTDPGPSGPGNGPQPVPDLGHLLNNTNNYVNSRAHTAPPSQEVNSNKNKNEKIPPPGLENVEAYFRAKHYPTIEARKFFYHYESTGWCTAAGRPIENWQPAADKWILNDKQPPHAKHYHNHQSIINSTAPKDYSIPF